MPLTRTVNLHKYGSSGSNTVNLDPYTYDDRYPWLDKYNYDKLSMKIDALGLSWYEREQAMDTAYTQVLPIVQNDIKNSDRRKIINQSSYEVSQMPEWNDKKVSTMKLWAVQLAQTLKEKYKIDASMDDEYVLKTWIDTIPDWEQLLANYLNNGNKELLYKWWLETAPEDIKQKLKDNFWDELWSNIKTKANVPVDNMKKRWQRTYNELSEKIYRDILKKTVWDSIIWEMGINLDDYIDTFVDNTVQPALREKTLDYQNEINQRYAAKEQKNLDQEIKNYYDNKWYTKLLKEWDLRGFALKTVWDAAQNREMPVVIAASVFQPEIWLGLMATDTYARENQEAYESMLNNWATYDEAEQWAVVVWLINSAVEVWLEKLIGWVETWASDAIRRTFMRNVTEEATKKWLGRILLEWAETQLKASAEEWLEEIVQQIVQNAAIKTVNENQDLFQWVGQAFEWGFYNPLNLLAWGWNVMSNTDVNKVRQSMMNWAYNLGETTRNVVDTVKNRKSNTSNEWVIDKVADWGAEKITSTVSPQDKLYKAQEPRMNVLSKAKDLEKRRSNSDRANELIVQNGYTPTDTTSRLQAHDATMKNIWSQVEEKINWWKEIMVDLSQISDKIDEYIQKQKRTKSTLSEADLEKLQREADALRWQQVSLPDAEALKQLYNAKINNRWDEKVSDVMMNWLKEATHEIWVIEDKLLSEIPWEFQWLKNDFWALADTYEDVFKADMKNQRRKWAWLTETYSRIEWLWDIANWVLGVVTWKWDLASIGKWAAKFLVWKSLAKASDVDFLIEQWFKGLAEEMGRNQGFNENQASSKTAKYQVADDIRDLTLDNTKKEWAYDPRAWLPKVRGGRTKAKIIKEISSPTVWSQVWVPASLQAISEFDNADDFKAHTFYHWTQGNFTAKPSMSIPEKTFDRMADRVWGWYWQRYWAISLTTDKKVASNFWWTSDHVNIYPVILRKNANVIEMSNLEDSADLEEHIEQLWNDWVDAVWIWDKNSWEKELSVLNPKAIVKLDIPDSYKQYHLWMEDNPLWIRSDAEFDKIYENANSYREELQEMSKKFSWIKDKFFKDRYGKTSTELLLDGDMERYKEWKEARENSQEKSEYEKNKSDYNTRVSEIWKDIRFQKYWVADSNSKNITAQEWLNIKDFRNGRTVEEIANQYWINVDIVDKILTPEWQKALGMYDKWVITLAKTIKESTAPHELLHAVFDMVDSSKKQSILNWIEKNLDVDSVAAEEWLADSFSEYYRNGTFWTKNLANSLVEKIKQFFREIKKFIDGTYENEMQIQKLFDDIIGWNNVWSNARSNTVFQKAWDIYSKNFKDWFGDWENWEWSKVVDKNGNPLVVYHGWQNYHTEFKKEFIWTNFGQDTQWFFFTDSKDSAREYADNTSYGLPRQNPGVVMDAYLSLKNPLIEKTDYDPVNLWDNNYERLLKKANDNGNDWIIIKADEWESLYVAFEPNQIKSATDNVGTYDPNNPDVRYQKYWVAWKNE